MTRVITMIALSLAVVGGGAHAQDSLPLPPVPSGSKAGPSFKESTYAPQAQPRRLPQDAPNILIIMHDDVGPALPDPYGGDIHTPTLSRVAKSGISHNRFHYASVCSPTRASLLTGRNPHRLGFGQIAELANDWEGYTGKLPPTAFGKWHNTPAWETTQQGPFDLWPTGRLFGFDYFYGVLAGESSQWEPAVVENTLRLPAPHREGYHFRRTQILTSNSLPAGKVKIEIDSRLTAQKHSAPMDVVIRVDGKEVAKGNVPVTASLTFTANDAFDVGMDSYSPVSLVYFDRAPFKFNGRIDSVYIQYQ